MEPKLEDIQCVFFPGRDSTDKFFTPQQIFEKSWEYAKDVHTYFIDKAY